MKKTLFFMITVIMLATASFITVNAVSVGDVVGNTLYTDIVADINNFDIVSYNIEGYTAVVAEDLSNYGFHVKWDGEERALYITRDSNNNKITSTYIAPSTSYVQVGKKAFNVYYTDIKTYINGKLVESYNIGGKTIIYFEDLKDFGKVEYNNTERRLSLSVKGLSSIGRGTRTQPYNADDAIALSYQKYNWLDPVRKLQVSCVNLYRGDAGAVLASNSYSLLNSAPDKNQEWIFMEFQIKYVSSEDGEDDVLDSYDIEYGLIYQDRFFNNEGASLKILNTAYFSTDCFFAGKRNLSVYPGGTVNVVCGFLVEDAPEDILLQIPLSNEKNAWIKCNSTGNTITDTAYVEQMIAEPKGM